MEQLAPNNLLYKANRAYLEGFAVLAWETESGGYCILSLRAQRGVRPLIVYGVLTKDQAKAAQEWFENEVLGEG